ncbi:MAG TPA: LuxR C-terminal-related transcriptional regulator, partial [Acidimicrobiales bacterium]
MTIHGGPSDAGVSEREAEVLELVAERATNAEIASRLFVSVRTVESHVSSLLRKLGASDRRELAQLAGGRHRDAAEAATDGLPVPLTSFVGRAAEVAELRDLLARERLVTAVGPGGVGKSRLAVAVAAELAGDRQDGVWFVDLVPVTDPAQIAGAVSAAIGLDEPRGRTVEEALAIECAAAETLLVLDNCEHLLDGVAPFLERLLGRCPRVSVLATSQARLMLPFERVFPVPGLSLPGEAAGDAVTLFVERARQAGAGLDPDDPEVTARIGDICRRLDGMALAIELAAARVPSLGLDGIEQGLSERLRLLAGGSRVDERHRSLRSTIDWSYGLLTAQDQALLRAVAVFAAPFTA